MNLFTNGIVSARPTQGFTLAVICGTVGWVTIATVTRLPVSTTHAIIGSLLGAGLWFSPTAIAWGSLAPRLAVPLLLSIIVSYAVSATLNRVFARRSAQAVECLCVGAGQLDTGTLQLAQINVVTGTTQECAASGGYLKLNTEALHWLSSGAVGFARGMNDTPKLVAIGAVVLGTQVSMNLLVLIVAGAMFGGSLYAGRRVARVLSEKIVHMDHREGLLANLATALLVGVGANFGLPMSTTHVSSSAIAGIAGRNTKRLNRRTLRHLALAWTVTPLVAGLIAGLSFLIAVRMMS